MDSDLLWGRVPFVVMRALECCPRQKPVQGSVPVAPVPGKHSGQAAVARVIEDQRRWFLRFTWRK